ncbi:MAG: DUF58 domain-containing protein [Lachnospiraceae bacterium]|nr:DUF58 domain-containing protein [Lachnospiraceae bacterium]
MIIFVFLFTIVILITLELISRRDDVRNLKVSFSLDMDLVEPGEVFTLRYVVANPGFLPVLSVGLGLQLEDVFTVCEEDAWKDRHLSGNIVDHRFYLLPHGIFSGKIRLSVNTRGMFDLGRCYMDKSDLLGLSSLIDAWDMGVRVICTAKTTDALEYKTLGGLQGNASVRRFIHEDPSMLMGYRDYTGHEPMKYISWFQTAKTGKLTVRNFDHTVGQNVTLLVDMNTQNRRYMENCLSLTRTVCEQLEEDKIPYAIYSNGDLHFLREGLGRAHLLMILRRIGLSKPAGYYSFASLVEDRISKSMGLDSYIVITPEPDEDVDTAIRFLQAHVDTEIFVLYGKEAAS